MTQDKLKTIKAIAFDIDGVFTDGGILAMPDGDLLRVFDAKDCFAVRMARMAGLHVAIITGGSSQSITRRFTYCGVPEEDIFLHSRIKMDDLARFCRTHSINPEEVMYFGDDLPDVPVLEACGIGVAPADAVREAKDAADYVSPFCGGRGCVRDTLEKLLKVQDSWRLNDQQYKKMF